MEEPGGLHAVHGVAKSWAQLSDFIFTFHFMHWRRKWQPTPVFLPGESGLVSREAKDSALLSSRDAGLLEPPERPQGYFLQFQSEFGNKEFMV